MNSGPIMQDRLWFFYATSARERERPARHLLQQECRRHHQVDLRSGLHSSGEQQLVRFDHSDASADRAAQSRACRWESLSTAEHSDSVITRKSARSGQSRWPRRRPARSVEADALRCFSKGTWTVTSRLLLDASYGSYHQDWNGRERPGNNRDLIRMTEQCTAGCANNGGGIPGLVYRAQVWNPDYMEPNRWQAAATYVTGAHNMKVGYQGVFHWNRLTPTATTTTSITGSTTACRTSSRSSRGRTSRTRACDTTPLTHRTSGLAEGSPSREPSATTTPGATIPRSRSGRRNSSRRRSSSQESKGVIGYHDINPRFGLAYDVFGNGKTALKFNTGRYLEAAVNGNGNYSALRPSNRVPTSVTRSWTDANGNFHPDCDLLNGEAQDLRSSGGDSCGRWSNPNFGKNVYSLSYDEAILKGWA